MHFMETTTIEKPSPKRKGKHKAKAKPSLSELRERAAVSLEEFALLFGRSKNWAYNLVWTGKILVIKPAGEMMVPQSEVARFTSNPVEYDSLPSAA